MFELCGRENIHKGFLFLHPLGFAGFFLGLVGWGGWDGGVVYVFFGGRIIVELGGYVNGRRRRRRRRRRRERKKGCVSVSVSFRRMGEIRFNRVS